MTEARPDKRCEARRRERRARKIADHILTAAVSALGGDPDDFIDEGTREDRKGRQRRIQEAGE